MKKISNEVKIGLTITVALVVAVIGFRFMQDIPVFRQSDFLYTHFDRVDGISPGSSILMSGVRVGTVREVRLTNGDSVFVSMNISFPAGIPRDSRAIIRSIDLIGNKAIVIERSNRLDVIPDGGYIEGEFDDGIMSTAREYSERLGPPVMESTEKLSSILGEVDRVLRDGGARDVEQFLKNLSHTTRTVDRMVTEKERDLTLAIESLHSILANVDTLSAGRKDQIDSLMTNLEMTTRELNTITSELGEVSRELNLTMKKVNNGEGSLGMLLNDPSLYNNLDSLSNNLNSLIENLNENPRHFLKHVRLIDLFR